MAQTVEKHMQTLFKKVQFNKTDHPRWIKELAKLYERTDLDEFWELFILCLQLPLTMPQQHPHIIKTLEFCANFCISFYSFSSDSDTTESMSPFLSKLFDFLLSSHNAKDKTVRYRICHFLNMLLNSMGDNAFIDDNLYDKITISMMDRLLDKSPKVRAQAVLALQRLQDPSDDQCPVIRMYLFHLSKDVSNEVRKAVLTSMGKNQKTLQAALARTRDIDENVRKLAYEFISKITVRSLTIKQRECLLKDGLKDRSEIVRACVCNVLLPAWLQYYQGEYINLIHALDAGIGTEIATLALQMLFKNADVNMLLEQVPIDKNTKLIPIKNLKIENVLYWKCAGHQAPILGLSLDPKEEFVASSGADGSIRVWNIKEKRTVHVWNNIVPKCNSFFTARAYCVPSFKCSDGSCLAYPCNKDVVIVERLSWKELYRLKCPTLRTELSICKFSECGTRIAASSLLGEIIVWNVETKEVIGYLEHEQDSKITALVWHIDHSNEIAFCDALGKLGCIEVVAADKSENEELLNLEKNEDLIENDVALSDDDDDAENVISLNKIKASVNLEDDQKSHSDAGSEKASCDTKAFMPNIKLQSSFQPGSTPSHLLSHFMMWNDVGMVRCFSSEDGEECSIEVEFHDVTVHRSMHINNYMRHSLAALSTQALALSCTSSDEGRSKVVVVALQGWGSGNKEWLLELPEDEESECLAAGDNFVAVATSRRNLRIFMIGGTQREILALPGPVVAMNGLGNHLVIAYHAGIGPVGDQNINLLWIQIQGAHLRSQTLKLPLSPASDLMWLGLSDAYSPTIMDSDDVIRIYDKRSCQWRVLCDANIQGKGKADHYFIIGVSERERNMRCILCKGSYYPPTTPRPIITEVSLAAPLCEPESEKTEKEHKLWELGTSPLDETEAVLTLIALACKSNLEYRAVDICEQIASTRAIDLAIRYALRVNKMALANKLEKIADAKSDSKDSREEVTENHQDTFTNNGDSINSQEEDEVPLPFLKKSDVEIKPLAMSQTLKRTNPFLKAGSSPISPKGLAGLNTLPEKSQKPALTKSAPVKSKPKSESEPKKESFVTWHAKNKKNLEEEFPEKSPAELVRIGLKRYKEETAESNSDNAIGSLEFSKKRKLSDSKNGDSNEAKRSLSSKLSEFAYNK